jgi:hypothetical protein
MLNYFIFGKGFKYLVIAWLVILIPICYWHYKQGDLGTYLIFLALCSALGYIIAKNI